MKTDRADSVSATRALTVLATSIALALSCGGSSSSSAGRCVPGASATCGGPAGCTGFQVCTSDGNGYGPCDCGSGARSDGGGSSSSDGNSGSSSGSGGVDGASADGNAGSGASDAADSSSAVGDSGSWTPAMLPGLSLWLDDTFGVVQDPTSPGQVIRWRDESGNGNDTVGGSKLNPQALNGHDTLIVNGNGLTAPSSQTLDFVSGTGDFAIALVVNVTSGISVPVSTLWGASNLGVSVDGANYGLTLVPSDGGASVHVVLPITTPDKFHILIARGEAMDLHTESASVTGPTVAANITTSGGGGEAVCRGGGQLAELLAIKGKLSDADMALLITYFRNKFKL